MLKCNGYFYVLMVFWYWYIQALDPYPSGNPAYDAFIGGIQAATQGIVNVSKILTLRQFNSNVLYINVMFHVTPYISALPQSYSCVERVERHGKLRKALHKRKEGSEDCRMLLELWGRHPFYLFFGRVAFHIGTFNMQNIVSEQNRILSTFKLITLCLFCSNNNLI